MTWSYLTDADTNNAGTYVMSDRDQVRLLIGDTNSADPQLQDQEIDFFLQTNGVMMAASRAAKGLAAKFARDVARNVGRLHIDATQKFDHYRALAKDLREQYAMGIAPFAGGTQVGDKQSRRDNLERLAPTFSTDLQELPGNQVRNPTPVDPRLI